MVADIDRDATARYGIPVRDVEDTLESGFGGQLSTSMWEGERKVGVRVKLPTPTEGEPRLAGAARRAGRYGNARIPLAPLANIHVDRGRTQINREQGGRFLAIKCNIEGPRHGHLRRRGAGRACASRSSCPRATT